MQSSINTSNRPGIPLRALLARGKVKQTLACCALTVLCAAPGVTLAAEAEEATQQPQQMQEVTVTANRREESASKVPISVSAYTQEAMDIKGIKDIDDIARYTPGVKVDSSQTNQISIRGISSSGGSGTTGIYIDDVPIQVRDLGFNADDALVKIFDLDRVEVLRGPQGTLFGAGSEGGTVRYITTQPSLTKSSVYAKAETSYTQGGAMSYETGVAAARRSSTAPWAYGPAPGIAATAVGSTASIRPRWRSWTRTRTKTTRRCCISPPCGNRTITSRSRPACSISTARVTT